MPNLTIPPTKQEKIVAFIAKEITARTERDIALMQEHRTRLTADLVTGKLDVREAVDKLSEPVDEEPAVEEDES